MNWSVVSLLKQQNKLTAECIILNSQDDCIWNNDVTFPDIVSTERGLTSLTSGTGQLSLRGPDRAQPGVSTLYTTVLAGSSWP